MTARIRYEELPIETRPCRTCGEPFEVLDGRRVKCERCSPPVRAVRPCDLCGVRPRVSRDRCAECLGVHRPREGASVHPSLPYELDAGAQAFVDAHPGGASLEDIAQAFGVTKERIRQIEVTACEKLARRLRLVGVDEEDVHELLCRAERRRAW